MSRRGGLPVDSLELVIAGGVAAAIAGWAVVAAYTARHRRAPAVWDPANDPGPESALKPSKRVRPESEWKRTAGCAGCRRRTVQLLHGYTAEGELWKGHACACRGWECSACQHLNDPRGRCCR